MVVALWELFWEGEASLGDFLGGGRKFDPLKLLRICVRHLLQMPKI